MRKFLSALLIIWSVSLYAQQETVVTGKILEKGKPEPLPFVSLGFKGTKIGTTTDFDGNFSIKTTLDVDTLIISYVGYKTLRKKIKRGQKQHLIIELAPSTTELSEVVIRPGENPALRIIKKAQQNRDRYDQSNLNAYEYDSYNKMDVSMNDISEDMKNNRMLKPIKSLFDTANQIKNDEGKYILPLFISETHSRYYANKNPSLYKEYIKASTIKGFGVQQGGYVVDLLGASSLQFNFNQNWIRILAKDFISPIATGSNTYYIYTLLDSVDIEGQKCYKIKLNLRREEDLGFLGTIWIADSSFAIKRIHVEIAPTANLNFIDRLKIQQEMVQTSAGPWLPSKTRVIVDIAQMSKNTSGFIAKIYRANTAFSVNQEKPTSFFDVPLERSDSIDLQADSYWDSVRTEPFSAVEQKMLGMIDSVQNLPIVKTYIDIIRLALEGYYRKGKIDYGPYVFLIGYNEVEHLRFRMGFKTNIAFSNRWTLHAYLAYGVNDGKFKYGTGVDYIISRKKWSTMSLFHKNDYDILGVTDFNSNTLQRNTGVSNLFAAINLGAAQSRINRTIEYRFNYMHQYNRDWSYRVGMVNSHFEPLGRFVFAYTPDPEKAAGAGNIQEAYDYTAATAEVRFAYKENMVVRNNERLRIARSRWPELTLTYTHGIKGLLGGDFDYRKMQMNITHHFTTGVLGNADYSITFGKTFGRLPYPMLDVPRGNATFLYNDINFSLMNLYEFVADEYSQIMYVQHFEGLFFNRVPLLKKWKLRNFALVKAAYGHLTDENKQFLPATDSRGRKLSPVYSFGNKPYAEVGYGIENIFRLLTVGVIHRVSYLNNVDVRKWSINLGLRITF